ncbi:AAA family ATPase [Duganella sp. FT92W]|uniref:AAA family ATPase n=1 Tax=Pseudoduganella rivuli TaxID=2666085 RepID=A0A7X2LY88_9BURK|nr:LuxR C-terminal-related transcriptional regulator [Pseudoduganella rivuli]MRV76724.1 AAA family ATPase [Pseudoduganella rivuli]
MTDARPDPIEPGAAPASEGQPAHVELTPRQQQIMELLRAGKVNKEIARELGIGVGTVKQHVVTLFKRLNVRNRTMAVTRGMVLAEPRPAETHEHTATAAPSPATGMLERRPCAVLSLALPAEADDAAVRRLHDSLAALACDLDAVFVARRGNAGDLIFGLHQVGERDLLRAMACAQRLYETFSAEAPALAGAMRGGLTVGIVVASMLRNGGWSGEAIVSTAIAGARELQEQAPAGQLALGRPVFDVMQAQGIRSDALFGAGTAPGAVAFNALAGMDWHGERIAYPLVGRADERKTLERCLRDAAAGQGGLLLLEGETGMGKSRLCKALLAQCRQAQGHAVAYAVPQDAAQRDTAGGVIAMLDGSQPRPGAPLVAVVDDYHFLSPQQRLAVLERAYKSAQAGALVVLSGRRVPETGAAGSTDDVPVVRLALSRLSGKEIEALVRQVPGAQGMPAAQVQHIVADAAGVPLFAVELARHCHEVGVALPLLVIVIARLDSLHLDRKLLRVAARRSLPPTTAEIAAMLGQAPDTVADAVQRAVASGVLREDADGRLDFGHPLLRKIIDYLSLE